ncbi:MAG: chemotaxis response regulator protein-glutamate methylesterase [Oscillospiraceae bacterium]|nr:chemotaxis response regulator protein-glutamate methylesterase [Oscillospiraceae bacterium]
MKKIKLLVVDDSILFREVLARYIRQDDQIEVIGTAGDAYSARDMIVKYAPDVMTLDIEMPRMDGIAFLRKLLPQCYIPTIVVSSCADRKADAQSAGATEFIAKPLTRTNSDMQKFAEMLCTSIKRANSKSNITRIARGETAAKTNKVELSEHHRPGSGIKSIAELAAERKTAPQKTAPVASPAPSFSGRAIRKSDIVVALGASTGGTEALEQVIRNFPEDMPPVIVVQHMPAGFTKMYSERLDRCCNVEVKEAEDGDRLRTGLVIIGAGEHHLRLCKDVKGYYISSKKGEKVSGHCPSVDVMFSSVAEVAKDNAIGAILTGMGRDGADGLLKMKNAGAFTVGQDKETCVVYGMPMEAYKIGAVDVQAPLYRIADIILEKLY